jgi:hypothetical protein
MILLIGELVYGKMVEDRMNSAEPVVIQIYRYNNMS